jgi:hypothetical protein
MAKVIPTACPKCGAALEVRPNTEMVVCRYCGYRSLIEWQGGKAPTAQFQQWRADPNFGRIALQAQKDYTTWIAIGTSVPAIAGVVLSQLFGSAAGPKAAPIPPPTVEKPNVAPAPAIVAVPKSPAPAANRVEAADLHKVELTDLIRQAHAVALAFDPHIEQLSRVNAATMKSGLVDTVEGSTDMAWSYRYKDPTKAPGNGDVVKGSVRVSVAHGEITATKFASAINVKFAIPKCTSNGAWAAAVKTGVPDNAIADFHLAEPWAFYPKQRWVISVQGHPEYDREVDAATCARVR